MINLGVGNNIFTPKFQSSSIEHPLEKYRIIADTNFISQVEDKFYTVYYNELLSGLGVLIERENDRMYFSGLIWMVKALMAMQLLPPILLQSIIKLKRKHVQQSTISSYSTWTNKSKKF